MRVENKNSYGVTPFRKQVVLRVECILDGVPGAFNQIEDHMNWICGLPYVLAVETVEESAD
jgi:hypothetical protein